MFIDNFRRLCASRGVPETRVTKELGIGGGTYMNWKNGSEPLNSTKKRIADYFGISIDELMSGADGDSEMTELLQACKDSPALRMMFQTFKNVKSSDILKVISDYQAMKGE